MRWHPPTAKPSRVIAWCLRIVRGTGRKRKWSWIAKSRNGRPLVESKEVFSSAAQAAQSAVMFGGPPKLLEYKRVTAFHDGEILPLNWSEPL